MKLREERKQRLGLTMLFSTVVFCLLVLTVIIVAIAVAILVHLDVLEFRNVQALHEIHLVPLLILSVVLGTALTFVAGRIPLKPINKIMDAMSRLAAGDYTTRLSFRGPLAEHPTVREVIDSFNAMAAELEGTEMLRSDFINSFSHEFNTPIVSIAGFAKLLKRGNLSEEEQKEYLDIIESESLRLSVIATNVLEMSKVEQQTILTHVAPFNLSEQLRRSVLLLERKWEEKHIEWELELQEHTVSGNEELLEQVWLNLLDNAIKFSPEWSVIRIGVEERGDSLEVSISNPGEEIPPESRSHLFQKFYQVDRSRSTEGNGIGLAVVQKVVELHHGSVSVKSDPMLTTFTVKLPKKYQP